MQDLAPSPLPALHWTLPESFARSLPVLVAAALLGGCAGPSAPPPPELTASTDEAIEGGRAINDGWNPISSLFPLSTVHLAMNAGTVVEARCTGILISTTKVLTAAHCVYGNGVLMNEITVSFYPTMAGSGASPVQSADQAVLAASAALPPNVTCPPETPDGGFDAPSCYNNGVYADMAVLTLPTPVSDRWKPVWLAPRGSVAALDARKQTPASWAVGTGLMNAIAQICKGVSPGKMPDPVKNAASIMEWVPVAHISIGGAGKIITNNVYADPGDSGGPLFEYASDGKSLVLVGVTSGYAKSCSWLGRTHYNVYVDVTEGSNYDWLVQQGATVAPATASFGAAL